MNQAEALVLTLALEAPWVVTAGVRCRIEPWRIALAWLLASCITHPLAWHAATLLAPRAYAEGWWAIELSVAFFEAVVIMLLMRLRFRHALMLSVLANGFSALVGVCLG